MRDLRRALQATGFTFDNVRQALGADESLTTPAHQMPLLWQRLGDRPLATLIRLFIAGASVAEQDARKALAPLDLGDAVSMGIVGVSHSRVHPAIRITPADDLVFASDLEPAGLELAADHVMGVADSSRVLARLTFRRQVKRALDLGTGCGYHAILAARHAQHVIATDINQRAIAFTAFNALLNDMSNVECRVGDRFEPLDGLEFDLIVSNPPFVISPDRGTLYRDSALGADRVSQLVVLESAQHLRPGGTAHILMSWIHAAGDDWSAPLRAWVADTGCDAWFIRQASYDPLAYAVLWNQRLAVDNMQRYTETIGRWTHYCERVGITAMGYGAALLRRRNASNNRIRIDDAPPDGIKPDAADDLERLMDVEDRLGELDESAFRERMLRVVPGTRFEPVMLWLDGGFRTTHARLARDAGLRPRAEIDPAMSTLLTQIDGRRTVGEVAQEAARRFNAEAPESSLDDALHSIRQFITHGFLDIV